jgi:uncharacterized repeat protein (TIGR03803 family)
MNAISKWTTAFGIATVLASAVTTLTAQAQSVETKKPDTFTSLYSFDSSAGNSPWTGLIQATDGNLYGTTTGNDVSSYIYKMTLSGTLTPFSYDGANRSGLPMQGTDGNLYWTSYSGGDQMAGAVVKTTLGGTSTFLYSFCSQSKCADGASPLYGPLSEASNGEFYGTTSTGGASEVVDGGAGYGTIFKITSKGKLTTIYNFCAQTDCTDGEYPYAGLLQTTNGDFYGTTYEGGAYGDGTIFKITPGGTLTTLYSFCSLTDCADGSGPEAALIQAANGDFYGTTVYGGANGSYGTVFKITPGGKLTTLYSFCAQTNCADGRNPQAGLIQASDGNFYSTTGGGGGNGNYGTVFKIAPGGKLTTLYSFCAQTNCVDGNYPAAGLLQATNGAFYGTTQTGGTNNLGTVFSVSVGLGPFVALQTTHGAPGAGLTILGTDLTGATSVTFNGTAATFTVVSATDITTTVPTGATTGTVQVATPAGTLSSSGAYTVETAEPVLSLGTGTYSGPQTVSITDATGGAVIYYTTNGKNPTTSSSVYAGPITVSSTETLKADAIAPGCAQSAVASAAYTIQ